MKINLRHLFLVLALALAACATITPYQPLRDGEGYAEQKIESNRYRVRFAGNSLTPRPTVENYLMYRAAEVTLANGYDYFVQADRNTEVQTRYTQSYGGGFDDFGPFWHPRFFGFGAGVSTSIPSNEYQADVDILMFKGKKPLNDTRAFDAREVKANLELQVVRPEKKN